MAARDPHPIVRALLEADRSWPRRRVEGELGEPGEEETLTRRLAGSTTGAAGDSQKYDPSPGDSPTDGNPRGESTSILSEPKVPGDSSVGAD